MEISRKRKAIFVLPKSAIENILTQYGVFFPLGDLTLYQKAITHESFSGENNQRLEFLGDGIIECLAKNWIYQHFPEEKEGLLSDLTNALVKNETLGKLATEIGLVNMYLLSSQEEGLRANLKALGCLFEAFMGALFLDMNTIHVRSFPKLDTMGMGYQICQLFFEKVLEKHVTTKELLESLKSNYKRLLQEKIQGFFHLVPVYLDINPVVDEIHHTGCYLSLTPNIVETLPMENFSSFSEMQDYLIKGNILLGEAKTRNKKHSQQMAAKKALEIIEEKNIITS